ncbi:MAG TPA: 23S rRNA (uridine(2552)-2'-O)-methyltransferase RlmE [Coxiellaceae bacterium]|nr:23S rRNA (uridine(2552)-2'-O)-methyltransferase RlmE [Coxiellaceae bacterium]
MSTSSKSWLKEHFSDIYVKQAHQEGYVSRAAYKLLEINKKDALIEPGMRIVDLGAAPGGWSQVASQLVGPSGEVFALDLLPMDPLPGVTYLQGDFNEQSVLDALLEKLEGEPVDMVISDMAPNMSGLRAVDQPRSMNLVELAWDLAQQILRPDGHFLVKVFQGEGADIFGLNLRKSFNSVKWRKPKSSRSRSREVYVLGKGFKE